MTNYSEFAMRVSIAPKDRHLAMEEDRLDDAIEAGWRAISEDKLAITAVRALRERRP